MNSFYSKDELLEIGFRSVGTNVKISKKSSFYHVERIDIGSHVRIDDFCAVSACSDGFVIIGNRVHIAAYCFIEAPAGVTLEDFSGLAARCDNYDGEYLTNPCVPKEFRESTNKPVHLKKHVVIGTGSTIMPGVTIGLGSAIGSMALVTRDIPDGKIAIGIPAKVIKNRSLKLLDLELSLNTN
jgi:acetyltransferase-like isoleucine patch superfamily enzyme